jgi:23S rRNA (cytidine1920-2'-O)/16S rRNA (cytidine1409-2'-O)-methyltransferase
LRNNPRIIIIENTDIRDFKKEIIKEKLDLIVCDVSFISLNLIIDSIISLMDDGTLAILLFKPQFEV